MTMRFLTAVFFSIFLYTGTVMATEEPKYSLESKAERYEIRKYDATLVAGPN